LQNGARIKQELFAKSTVSKMKFVLPLPVKLLRFMLWPVLELIF
jgi:hypothetical protein